MFSCWQLAISLLGLGVTTPVDESPERWQAGGSAYLVSVQSFHDSNGDGIGDLEGLRQKLDYLNDGAPETTTDLGIDALILMPIAKSGTVLAVDPLDPRAVEPALGTEAEFDSLLAAAHRRGIRLLLSLVINHTSDRHPWFVAAAAGDSAMRARYVFRAHDLGWTQPFDGTRRTWHALGSSYYYGLWWEHAPDLELGNRDVRDELLATLGYWLDRGVDGFVIEDGRYLFEDPSTGQVADHPETVRLLSDLCAFVAERKPEATMTVEAFGSASEAARYRAFADPEGAKRGSLRLFPAWVPNASLQGRILRAVRKGAGHELSRELADIERGVPPVGGDVVFLSHYKRNRVGRELQREPLRLANAAAVQLTLPGLVLLYYGDELGLTVVESPSDAAKRSPMPWTAEAPAFGFSTGTPVFAFAEGANEDNVATESVDERSLLSRYRKLLRVRQASPALRTGSLRLLSDPEKRSPLVAFLREAEGERVLVVHNVADRPSILKEVDLGSVELRPIFVDEGIPVPTEEGGRFWVTMPPRSTGIWALNAP